MFQKTWFKVLIGLSFLAAGVYSIVGSQQTYLEKKTAERLAYEDGLRKPEGAPLHENESVVLNFYPIDESWILEGSFQELENTSNRFSMMMTDSTFEEMAIAGKVVVAKGDQSYELLVFDEPESYLLPFVDATCENESYGGGRYINIPKKSLKNGRLKVDFNDAANFYCAYTPDYICPIPPRENMITLAVTAGEKKPN